MPDRSRSSAAGSPIAPKWQSRIRLPPSVRNGRPTAAFLKTGLPPSFVNRAAVVSQPKWDNFHRDRNGFAQAGHQFRLVRDDHQTIAGRGDDFFAQQSSTQTFDQIQRVPCDLVGAVDGQVDLV